MTLSEDEIEFNLEPIYTPGFSPELPPPFQVSGNTEFMSFRKNYISHPYVGFLLFMEPSDVKYLVKFAQTSPDIDALLKEFRTVMRATFKLKVEAKRATARSRQVVDDAH